MPLWAKEPIGLRAPRQHRQTSAAKNGQIHSSLALRLLRCPWFEGQRVLAPSDPSVRPDQAVPSRFHRSHKLESHLQSIRCASLRSPRPQQESPAAVTSLSGSKLTRYARDLAVPLNSLRSQTLYHRHPERSNGRLHTRCNQPLTTLARCRLELTPCLHPGAEHRADLLNLFHKSKYRRQLPAASCGQLHMQPVKLEEQPSAPAGTRLYHCLFPADHQNYDRRPIQHRRWPRGHCGLPHKPPF
mmetsp:Transcript_87312/g.154757  ORF Transcript_87312/g.154757 Transcript_87312/m.154757 type:complete len:243 (+) Transcript_87312:264-992(+)